jgi:anti-sigma B factor antagonist
MEIRVEHQPGKSIITIEKNRLLGPESESIQNLITESIDKGSKEISINMSNVDYITSWGIGILVQAYTSCTNKGISFNLGGVKENVISMLHQIKLDTLFNIKSTV